MSTQNTIPEFCIQVRAACIRKHIKQDELAKMCDCSRYYLYLFLNGRRNVPRIAEKLREIFPEITVPYEYVDVA